MKGAVELAEVVGKVKTCHALAISRASFYRFLFPKPKRVRTSCPSPRSLSSLEQQKILEVLHDPRFMNQSPAEVYASLLDEGVYLGSISTMYRILRSQQEVRERRNQLRHPVYAKPELLATAPNQVWSWDITKLFGPVKWTYYYLYVILDILSRYVVGWMAAYRESAELAKHLIKETSVKQGINRGQLTIHADRGPAMKSKPVAFLLADLGITKSHSRPYVSNDNPFSESQFKTLKYHPEFPERFGSLEEARAFCQQFFTWYNQEHHHSGIGYLTPADFHEGRAEQRLGIRRAVLKKAYAEHPERFVKKLPEPPLVPKAVWINPPLLKNQEGGMKNDRSF